MSIIGWYYLHINGSLIYKPDSEGVCADIRDSDFARSMWSIDPSDRENAWNILVEALSLGADKKRIDELAEKWRCDDEDAGYYADRLDITLEKDGNAWCAKPSGFVDLAESPAGFGDTCLEALAALCEEVGYSGGKMWNATFKDLCIGKKSDDEKAQEMADAFKPLGNLGARA